MAIKLDQLERHICEATGSNEEIDQLVAQVFGFEGPEPIPPYTSSVDSCIKLVRDMLPDWHWHIGYGPLGIMPYATMTKPNSAGGTSSFYIEATAPTFPLALLLGSVKAARLSQTGDGRTD